MTEEQIINSLQNYHISRVECAYNNFYEISIISLMLDDGRIITIQSPRGLHFDEFNKAKPEGRDCNRLKI